MYGGGRRRCGSLDAATCGARWRVQYAMLCYADMYMYMYMYSLYLGPHTLLEIVIEISLRARAERSGDSVHTLNTYIYRNPHSCTHTRTS